MNEKRNTNRALDAVTKSIEMWSWMYQNPSCKKATYFHFKKIKARRVPLNYCYLCQFAWKYAWESDLEPFKRGDIMICSFCPIAWTGVPCSSRQSPYYLWEIASDVGIRKQATADMLKILYKTKRRLRKAIKSTSE